MVRATHTMLTLVGLNALLVSTASAEVSGTWEHEWAYNSHLSQTQKSESLLDLEWSDDIGENASLTAIGRLRFDSVLSLSSGDERADTYSSINGPVSRGEHYELGLRELYLDTEFAGGVWRMGKQQVVWGEADGLKVLDAVNPQNFREFILDEFDDSRIPTWMVNAEFDVTDESSLQLLWIMDTSLHELPESDSAFAFSSRVLVPGAPSGVNVIQRPLDTPDESLGSSEIGLRYTAFLKGWDVSLNYLYHYNDFPVLYQDLAGNTVTLAPQYERSHLIGGSLSNAFGELTLRAEVGLNTHSYFLSQDLNTRGVAESEELSSVIGLDWHGFSDTLLSAQWFQSSLLDYDDMVIRDRTEHTISLLYERTFSNDTWTLETLWINSLNNDDGLVRPKLTYNVQSHINVWLGADVFYGDEQGIYGQFEDRDRVLMGGEVAF